MTEEQFTRAMYPRVVRAAKRLAHDFKGRLDYEDLAQIGALAIVQLYRKQGSTPDIALAGRAAWCQMLDTLRVEVGRPKTESICGIPDGWTEDKFPRTSDHGRQADQLERAIDLRRMLATISDPQERAVIESVLDGRTFYEIGAEFRFHFTRASQIKRAAVARLRKRFVQT